MIGYQPSTIGSEVGPKDSLVSLLSRYQDLVDAIEGQMGIPSEVNKNTIDTLPDSMQGRLDTALAMVAKLNERLENIGAHIDRCKTMLGI